MSGRAKWRQASGSDSDVERAKVSPAPVTHLSNGAVARLLAGDGHAPAGRDPVVLGAVVEGLGAPAGALAPAVQRSMEAKLGAPVDGVRVHTGATAGRSAEALGARAFTAGDDVVLARPADLTDSRGTVLAHELTHVLQNRRSGSPTRLDRVTGPGDAVEREAHRGAALAGLGLPAPPVAAAGGAVALTPAGDEIEKAISYGVTDLAVTAEEENRIVAALEADPNPSLTVEQLRAAGVLDELIDRVDEPDTRRRLLQVLGGRLTAAARAVVEPHVRTLGPGAELQFNLGRFGVGAAAPAYDPAPAEAALVGTARTGRMGHAGGHLTEPFTGVGATGVIPTTRYAGTMYTSPGVPQIPVDDQLQLLLNDPATVATYHNPIPGSLPAYLATLTPAERVQQAELLLRRKIATVQESSYAGDLPSRAQVIDGAARAHKLHPQLVAAFILAEQRDQSQAEDAKDYQGATSVARADTSIGLGQVNISTARRHDLFADLMTGDTRQRQQVDAPGGPGGHTVAARLLASDEYNIFAVARYLRWVADRGAAASPAALPNTVARWPGIDLAAYAGVSAAWPDDNIRALGSEYTSTPWDDSLRPHWGDFVWEAYQDVLASGVF